MNIIKPPRLKAGDTIGLVSISNNIFDREDRFKKSITIIEQEFGIKVKLSPHALGRHHYSSGTVQERLDDLHTFAVDPEIKAIQFTVGGETAIELVDKINYDLIKDNPKIYCGLSDCTTLLNPIFARTGLITFHGFEFSFLGYDGTPRYMLDSIRQNWFEGGKGEIKPNPAWRDWRSMFNRYQGWQTIRAGHATGLLVGGNFGSLIHLLDTKYMPSFKNTILFIEHYKRDKDRYHHHLAALKLRGVFDQINGLIMGYNVGFDQENDREPEWGIKEVLLEITGDYSFPIMQIGEIGHYVENAIFPIGAQATIDATQLKVTIDEAVVI